MIDEASTRISLGRGMAETKQFFDETGVPLAALSMGRVEELSHREIPGMHCHKVEKLCLGFDLTGLI